MVFDRTIIPYGILSYILFGKLFVIEENIFKVQTYTKYRVFAGLEYLILYGCNAYMLFNLFNDHSPSPLSPPDYNRCTNLLYFLCTKRTVQYAIPNCYYTRSRVTDFEGSLWILFLRYLHY